MHCCEPLQLLGMRRTPKRASKKGQKQLKHDTQVDVSETALCYFCLLRCFRLLHVFQLAQLRRSPLNCESLWGWQAEDVSLVAWPLVWPKLGKVGLKLHGMGRLKKMQGGMEEFAESV